jgi:hypothetical protein
MAGEEQGIYYWDHNDFFSQSTDGEGNAYFVADSFTELCNSLKDYSPAKV